MEGLQAPGKRAHTTLSSAMEGLGMGQQAEQEGAGAGEAPADAEAAAEGVPAAGRRRQRYRKLSTLSAAQIGSMDQQKLTSLLAANYYQQQQQQQQQRAGVKSGTQASPGASTAAATAERAAARLQAGQAARYEQIRRRRGLTNFSITEQAADPLTHLAAVYDLVRHDSDTGTTAADEAAAAASGRRLHFRQDQQQRQEQPAQQQQRRPSRQQRAAQQYDEGTLMCNYLPMIREYLQAQGRDLPLTSGEGAGGAAAVGAEGDQAAGAEGAAAAADGEESDSDYVYDLYAAVMEEDGVGEDEEAAARQQEDEEAWWELHASGRAPVVQVRAAAAPGAACRLPACLRPPPPEPLCGAAQLVPLPLAHNSACPALPSPLHTQIVDDDTGLVIEQSDVDDSDADSEDSNAEGFYAHDYPGG